ncbi:MAG: hypothetical protein AAGG68_10410 [Bacteroidota bacterium]
MRNPNLIKYCFFSLVVLININISIAQSQTTSKIKGITYRGPELAPLHLFMFRNIAKSHASWVSFVPAFVIDRQTLQLLPETRKYRWYESQIATMEGMTIAKQMGYKIFLKPHLRLLPKAANEESKTIGSWRGTFAPKNNADWEIWEAAYEKWMLDWAHMADSLQVEMLCIGTELRLSAIKRTAFWRQLIPKIRAVYDGRLTYSANWDEYKQIRFWKELDYVGVNAYFPIHEARIPSVQEAVKAWKKHKKQLKRNSKKIELPILFTEFGYRNIQFAAKEPWQHEKVVATLNDEAQANLYQAFFKAFAQEKWVAGYFLWQWLGSEPSTSNTLFTPQGKPALKVLQKWYQQ